MSIIEDYYITDTHFINYLDDCDNDVKNYLKKKLCKDVYKYLLTFLYYEALNIDMIHRVKGKKTITKIIYKKRDETSPYRERLTLCDYYDNNLKMERRLIHNDKYGFYINYKSKEEDYKILNRCKLSYVKNANVYLYRRLHSMKQYDNI